MKKKLVDLLNEFESTKKIYVKWNLGEKGNIFQGNFANTDLKIISKKYEFIKWLVDNDKIDFEKERNKEFKRIDFDLAEGMDGYEITTEDVFLMWLSIQDNPIEFLCEILK